VSDECLILFAGLLFILSAGSDEAGARVGQAYNL
jgi:hypothetical protein